MGLKQSEPSSKPRGRLLLAGNGFLFLKTLGVLFRALVFVQVVCTLFLSSLLITAVQFLVSVSRCVNEQRRKDLCRLLGTIWWRLAIFVQMKIFNFEFVYYGDEMKRNKSAVFMSNHIKWFDFFTVAVNLSTTGVLKTGNCFTFAKKAVSFIPGFGTICYFQGSIFLDRIWQKDSSVIEGKLKDISKTKNKFVVALFPEGTRFAESKVKSSNEFAKTHGLPFLKNVLLPRKKAFLVSVKMLRDSLDVIYDLTVAYSPKSFILSDFVFRPHVFRNKFFVHVHRRIVDIKDVPETDEGVEQWLYESFEEKDKKLEFFKANARFDSPVVKESISLNEGHYHAFCIISGFFLRLFCSNGFFLRAWSVVAFLTYFTTNCNLLFWM